MIGARMHVAGKPSVEPTRRPMRPKPARGRGQPKSGHRHMSSRGMIEQVWTDSRIAGAMPRQPPGPGVLVLPPPPRPRTVDSELDLGHGGYLYGLIGEGKGDFEGWIGVDAFLWGCHAWRSLSRVLGVDLYCPLTVCQIREGWSRGAVPQFHPASITSVQAVLISQVRSRSSCWAAESAGSPARRQGAPPPSVTRPVSPRRDGWRGPQLWTPDSAC